MAFTIRKNEDGFEHIAFAEVLVPDKPNVYGDFHTKESVRDFAYGFMVGGFSIDVEHDNNDVTGKVHVVESFIARPGDPDFVEGAWVVGIYVPDDELWQDILDNKINGFSYEALVSAIQATVDVPDIRVRTGITEPDPFDGHTHYFTIVLGDDERPYMGGTSYTNGHVHSISTHTYTDDAFEHKHRYNFIDGKDGM